LKIGAGGASVPPVPPFPSGYDTHPRPKSIITIIAINSTKLMQLLAAMFAVNIAPSAETEADPTGRPEI
jgi:hypothetical protein